MDENSMSDEGSIKYWEAVLETIKLIRGLKQYQEEHPQDPKPLTDHLAEIMQKAAAKTGGTSSLTQELGLSFITRQPSTYWKAVEDTVRTVRSFIIWKEENPTDPRDLDSFLVEFWSKAEQKVQKASPLAQELGMDFLVSQPPAPSVGPITKAPPTTPTPAPEPTSPPTFPEPTPAPVEAPISIPEPEPTPAPVEAPISIPEPEPQVTPKPTTVPAAEAGPAPPPSLTVKEVAQPIEIPEPEPIPIPKPAAAPPPEESGIRLSEALLSQLREEEPPVPEESRLTDELLETSEDEEDLLSSSLRAALKMLRDDEDD
jgi:hypothetical protein